MRASGLIRSDAPACWAIFAALQNAGEPPLAPAPMNALLGDAYAAQHPGTPSPQAIQSVAVHLLTLHGVLADGVGVDRALWLRLETLQERSGPRKGRYSWLEPPDFAGPLAIADIVRQPTPQTRSVAVARYVEGVYRAWAAAHGATIAGWYNEFVGGGSGRR